MKHLLLVLLFFASLSSAQAKVPFAAPEPPKKANAILVTTADSAGLAWRKIREALLEQGYGLAQSDNQVYSFVTMPKAIKADRTLTVTGFVRKTDAGETVISMSGSYHLRLPTTQGQTANEVTRTAAWKGGGMGTDTSMFLLVEQIAKAYPGQSKPLTYLIR